MEDTDGLTVSIEEYGTLGENECCGLIRKSKFGANAAVAWVAVTKLRANTDLDSRQKFPENSDVFFFLWLKILYESYKTL